MTSVFRRRIAQRVLSTIEEQISRNYFLEGADVISPLLKVKRFGRNVPQLQLPWNKLLNLKPDLENHFKPANLIKALRNQGLPNTDGVTDISFDNSPPSSILFTLDGHIFTKAVLMDTCVNLDVLPFKSCSFHNIIPKKVVIEHSSPKLGKPLDMSNFRPTIHGKFIANINRFVGHDVTSINTIEDFGLAYVLRLLRPVAIGILQRMHMKCLRNSRYDEVQALLVAGYEVFGIEEQLEKAPNIHLSEVLKAAYEKSKADDAFKEKAKLYYKKMVDGDMEILSVLKTLRDPCVKEFRRTYKVLGVGFDEILYDSMYSTEIIGIEQELIEKQLIDNQQSMSGNGSSSSENVTVQKPVAFEEFFSPTYSLVRSIGAALHRKNRFDFDEMYYVANSSEKKKFFSLCSMLEVMGHDWHSIMHHVRLENIKSYERSKKKADLIDDVLQAAKISILKDIRESIVSKMEGDVDDIASYLSTASLIVYDMAHRKNRNYSFDLNKALRVKENSGISLQLCHAALTELLDETNIKIKFDVDTSPLTQAEAISLIRHLSRFDEIVFKAYYTLEPCIIVQYLFTLSSLVEKAIGTLSLSLKDDRLKVVKARLLLFHATHKVLRKGLQLLGIKPLERF